MFGFFKKKDKVEEKKNAPIGPWCTLNNEYKVPRLSVNLDNVPKEQMVQYVTSALQVGYRMFDFENENTAIEEIAQAVENSGIHRNQIFYSVSIKWVIIQVYGKGKIITISRKCWDRFIVAED